MILYSRQFGDGRDPKGLGFTCGKLLGVLLMNNNRHGRVISNSALCPMCNVESESILHCLRDCVIAKDVWSKISDNWLNEDFFLMSLKEWLLFNFANQKEINNAAWSTIFGVVVSMLCHKFEFLCHHCCIKEKKMIAQFGLIGMSD